MIGKKVVSGISLILLVGVVIGVVAAIIRSNRSNDHDNLSPEMKAVTQICEPTIYKETCMKSLSSVNSTDLKELIKAGLLAIQESLNKSVNVSEELIAMANNAPQSRLPLEDCKEFMQKATGYLQDTSTKILSSDLHAIANRDIAMEFRVWLSYVIAYQEMCLDEFLEGRSTTKSQVEEGTEYTSQLTDNVMMILASFSEVLKSFGLNSTATNTTTKAGTSRRLLEANGYPTWMSAADRKLLARGGRGGRPPQPNAVVAQDGSGQFKSISEALNSYPKNFMGPFVIYVKAGIYNEQVLVTKDKPNVHMYGDGPEKTIVRGSKSMIPDKTINPEKTATFGVEAEGFIAKSMGFENTAGPPGKQALALRVLSDKSAFFKCRIEGYQDTLFYHGGRQFYSNCVISGTIDFLYGYGSVVIQNSMIIVRKPAHGQYNVVTADGRSRGGSPGGLVIHNCRIVAEEKLIPDRFTVRTYLGRPWKDLSRTVVMQSELGDFIQPEGWIKWEGKNNNHESCYYAEYGNRGPGADTSKRVNWKTFHVLKTKAAAKFTARGFLAGGPWIRNAGIPVVLGLQKPN